MPYGLMKWMSDTGYQPEVAGYECPGVGQGHGSLAGEAGV